MLAKPFVKGRQHKNRTKTITFQASRLVKRIVPKEKTGSLGAALCKVTDEESTPSTLLLTTATGIQDPAIFMRKLRETEPCSGTISHSNSNNSIQSVTDDYEQLETKETLELTIVTATTTTTAVPAAEEASTHDCSCRPTRNTSETQVNNLNLAIETTTCGNDEAERPTLSHELCKRTEEAHSNDNSSVCSVVLESKVSSPYFAPEATDTSAPRTIVSIECQQASLSSDPDSALSSMSPQPNSFTGDTPQDDPWNVQHTPIGRDEGKLARIKLELDEMQQRYDTLNRDYTLAKEQIDHLEQELVKATQASREQSKLNERIAYLVK
uniref:Uncharacterized protein n=1 Tax=Anopheles maculatus TaxID=74869 RepID=A0A182SZH1_9DIPT